MEIRDLLEIDAKYITIELEGELTRYRNEHFEDLLIYIGAHYPAGTRNEIGCAYKKIKEKTDELLLVSKRNNRRIKTSKREIASIRQAKYSLIKSTDEHYYIRIPYKVSFIFAAIISIVDEISREDSSPAILRDCIGHTYRENFYEKHISEYLRMYHAVFKPQALLDEMYSDPAKLYNDFFSVGSVFNEQFT